MQQIWRMLMIWHVFWANATINRRVWAHFNQRFKFIPKLLFIKVHYHVLMWTARWTCSNMHETSAIGKIVFFWSIFIYKSFPSELLLNLYDFLKFIAFSGISWIVLNQIILENHLLRQHDIMLTSAGQQTWSKSNLTGGSRMSVS